MGDPVCIHSVVSLKIAAPSSSKKHSVGAMYCNKTVYIDLYMYIHIYIYIYIYIWILLGKVTENIELCAEGGIETFTKMVPSEQSCGAQISRLINKREFCRLMRGKVKKEIGKIKSQT